MKHAMKTSIFALLAPALAATACAHEAERPALTAPSTPETPPAEPAPSVEATLVRSGTVAVGDIDYYYEIHGRGEPLLLLHGGLGSIDMFRPLLPELASDRQIVAVDLQGHGRTNLGDRPIRLTDLGDDLVLVLSQLGYDQVDVLGYSMGGGAALRLAVQHPNAVRRLALVSAGFARDGFYAEMLGLQAELGAAMADQMKATPMYQSYVAVAPHPEDFPRLLDRMGELMRTPYDWSNDVATLKMPVMLVYADSDMYRPEHIVEFYQLLGGGLRDAGWQREHMSQNRLAILPDATHYDIFLSPSLPTTVLPFLAGKTATRTWAEQVAKE